MASDVNGAESTVGFHRRHNPRAVPYRPGGNVRLFRYQLDLYRLCKQARPAPVHLDPDYEGVVV